MVVEGRRHELVSGGGIAGSGLVLQLDRQQSVALLREALLILELVAGEDTISKGSRGIV